MADDDRRSVGVRVRPNSHDFIRQLRADLATKKYTYYVTVGAKTTQATKDVREWRDGPLQKIHAAVPVKANTTPANINMADWRRAQAKIPLTIKVHADTSEAVREIEALRAMARDITIKVKADTSRAAARAASAGGGRSRASNIDKEFQAGFSKATKKEMEDFARQAAGIKLDVDDTAAKAKVKKVKAEAEKPIKTELELEVEGARRQLMALKIQEKSKKLQVGVNYDPTDIKQMKLVMAKLRLQEQARDIQIGVKVSRSSLERIKDAQNAIKKQFGSASLIRSLDFGPLNLGKPTGLVGMVSSLTILAGALPGAVAGVTALSDGLVRLSAAAALVPGAIGAIAASMATLTVGTKGIGDAFTSMFAMWDEGASQQGKASTKLVSAQNNYKDAVVAEGRAQERVADARRSALGELRNLNNELRGGVLNEAQALLDLQKARDRYAQGGFDNQTDRLQAQLDIQKAELNVATTREDNLNLQQKANDANVKGVEGSNDVRDALEAQRKATEAVTEATAAMTAGGAGATTAAQKFADQLAQLSPNARDFVETIGGMKDELYGFRNAIQDTIFQGTGPAFKNMFDDLLPVIQPGMDKIAQGLNQNILSVFDSLKTPDGKSIIERILGGTADTQKALTGLINPLIKGFGTLVAAGTEHMPQVVNLFTRLAERFAAFIDKADKSGALDKFLDKGVDALENMAEIGINLIKIVNDLSDAFGGDIIKSVKDLTDKWHEFLSSEEGQRKLKQFLDDATELWKEWKPVLMELPGVFATLSEAAKNVLGYILPTIEGILGFLNDIPGALEVIATVMVTSSLLGRFSSLATTVGVIFKALKGMPDLINKIPGVNIPGLPGTNPLTTPGTTPPLAAPGIGPSPKATSVISGGLTTITTLGSAYAIDQAIQGTERANMIAGQIDPLNAKLPKDFKPITGSQADLATTSALESLASQGDKGAKWVLEAGSGDTDAIERTHRYLYLATHPYDSATFKPPEQGSYMSGGYTDWGASRGQMAMLHGGEYVEPKHTVDHYGVDAMKAVHDKRATISFSGGGMMPLANPNWGWNPGDPGAGGRYKIYDPITGWRGDPPIGGALGPPPGISPPGWVPGMGPGGDPKYPVPGTGGGWLGPSPFHPLPQKKKEIHAFAEGGVVPQPDPAGAHGSAGIYHSGAARPVWGGWNWVSPDWLAQQRTGTGKFAQPYVGWNPEGQPGNFDPGAKLDTSTTGVGGSLPIKALRPDYLAKKLALLAPYGTPPVGRFGQGTMPHFQEGGLVWDPNLQQYVQTGSAVSHGQNPTQGGPGIIDTIAGAVTEGVATAGNVASQATSIAQAAAGGAGGFGGATAEGTASATPGGVLDIATGVTPGGAAPGPGGATPGSTDGKFTTGSPFGDAFLGALGVPGLGGDGQGGPGWGEKGPPIGLGGGEPGPNGEAPMDIRNFGIGPGPPGSGPTDWMKFAGEQLGTFGAGLFTTFAQGALDFVGLGGIMQNFTAAGGIASHFLTPADKSKAQGPGAADTNAAVSDLLNTAGNMPDNPAYPGVPNLPNVIDPSTGSAVGGGGGLQVNTARGKAIIQRYFPWATNIGGVRPDALKWHPSGLALDVMIPGQGGNNDPTTPEGLALGNQLHAWLSAHAKELGIDYMMWQEKDHYNHIHVNFAPSGFGSGGGSAKFQGPGIDPDLGIPAAPAQRPPKVDAPVPPPQRAAPQKLPPMPKTPVTQPGVNWLDELAKGTHDQGGWLMPGVSVVSNMTGSPELVLPGFQGGGYNFPTGAIPFKPRPPDILAKTAPPPVAVPKPSVPSITPAAPPPPGAAPPAPGEPAPAPTAPSQGPSGGVISTAPSRPTTGPGVKETGDHVHPALRKGITSGFATAGNIASTAISIAASLGGAAMGGAGGAGLGAAGGGIGGFVSGLFQQAGKIANNAANVASSFLVGNITAGTTENPYGVTQRASVPTGGTKVIDASNNQYGDVYTNNIDEYFKRVERRDNQKAQSGLGRWGTQI